MKNKVTFFGMFFAFLLVPVCARSQTWGINTNVVGWAAATPNIGMEVGFAKKWSLEMGGAYNPFSFKEGRKTNLWAARTEVKFWPRSKFKGLYVGVHGQYAQYDWGLWKYRYKGDLGGCGLSCGYAWMLSRHWSLEAGAGLGWNLLMWDQKYDRKDSLICYGPETHGHWGVTKIGIKIVYLIK